MDEWDYLYWAKIDSDIRATNERMEDIALWQRYMASQTPPEKIISLEKAKELKDYKRRLRSRSHMRVAAYVGLALLFLALCVSQAHADVLFAMLLTIGLVVTPIAGYFALQRVPRYTSHCQELAQKMLRSQKRRKPPAPAEDKEEIVEAELIAMPSPPRFQCPECGESIPVAAKFCRFCNVILSQKDKPPIVP